MKKAYYIGRIVTLQSDTFVYLRPDNPIRLDKTSDIVVIIEAVLSNPFFIQPSADPANYGAPLYILQ